MIKPVARVIVCAGMGAVLCGALLGGCKEEPQISTTVTAPAKRLAAGRVMATIPDETTNLFQVDFSPYGDGVAFVQESPGGVRVVHNGRAGELYKAIGTMKLGPDGVRTAYTAYDGKTWRLVLDGRPEQASGDSRNPVFSPDGRHLAYESRIDGKWHLVLDGVRYDPSQKDHFYHDKFFSADSQNIITVESSEQSGDTFWIASRGLSQRQGNAMAMSGSNLGFNKQRTRVAVIEQGQGQQRLVVREMGRFDAVSYSPWYEAVMRFAFSETGDAVAYVAQRAGKRYFVMNEQEHPLPDNEEVEFIAIRPDKNAAGLIMNTPKGVYVYHYAGEQWRKGRVYDEVASLGYSRDGDRHFYVARKGRTVLMVVNGKAGPAYDMVVSPLMSADGRFLVYRARKDGKRFVVVADGDGTIIREHPRYEQVFPVVFGDEERSVGYGVKDGNRLVWKVEWLEQERPRGTGK